MLSRQLSAAEFRDAFTLLFEVKGSLRECVIHVQQIDQRSLKKAYRRRAHETHPDRAHLQAHQPRDPDEAFRAVVAAYELLRMVQQGDLEVALPAAKRQATGSRRPERPVSTHAKRAQSDASPTPQPRPRTTTRAQTREGPSASATAEAARRARQHRRAHRAEQPFTASGAYQRWNGQAAERSRPRQAYANTTSRPSSAPAGADSAAVRRKGETVLPARTLQLGQYLYYAGVVSWRQLIDALVWQRRQRPLIGQLALAWGLLDRQQISDVLKRRRALGRYDTPFAEFAMQCGYLTASQHRSLCSRAQLMQQRLGRYFVEQGILSEAQLADHLRAQRLHNWRLQRRANAHG